MADFPAPRPKGLCFYCDDPAKKVIEVRISDTPVPGSRLPRGAANASVTRRCCTRHARAYFDLLQRQPVDKRPDAERRTGMDRRA